MTDTEIIRRDFYVYAYLRDGAPVYIGKGSGKRWLRHASATGHNQRLHRMIQKDHREGTNRITKEKLGEALSEPEAFALEIELIAQYGRVPHGPLVNSTDGGEGAVNPDPAIRARVSAAVGAALKGHPVAAATREKLRAAFLGRPRCPEAAKRAAEANRGQMRTEEQRARMSASQIGNQNAKGRKISDETRAKLSAWQVGRKMPPEAVAKTAEANRGRPLSDEHRAKLSAIKKGRSPSREHRAALAAALKGRIITEDAREKQRQAMTGRRQDRDVIARRAAAVKGQQRTPEQRARISAAAKANWERRRALQEQ